jgi:tRNA(fMet)-specific endonuclease VapC
LIEYLNPQNRAVYVSLVSVAETQSITFQNNWGKSKMRILEDLFNSVSIINVSDLLVESYIMIDSFSQRNNPMYTSYSFDTPRNMGKNDLWIAATASVLNLELITTDSDFDHLDGSFIKLRKIFPIDIYNRIGN